MSASIRSRRPRGAVRSWSSSVTAYVRQGGSAGTSVTFTVVAEDNVDPAPTVFCFPPSGSVFPLGTTSVSCTAFDAAGNQSATRTFPVVVREKRQQVGF